jgi:hypothetical protein
LVTSVSDRPNAVVAEDSRVRDDGCLSPWADATADAPGWQLTTRSRRLAVAMATVSGGTVHSHEQGEWHARIPQAVLTVVVISVSADTLRCCPSTQPPLGVLALGFAPWPAAAVLTCAVTALPAYGRLSVRDVRVTTRMGRTVRYLIPAFTTT